MAKPKTTYLLDTNVLLTSPYAIFAFDEHDVSITDATLEELDKLKTSPGEKGVNAREAIRQIDTLREEGSLLEGVPILNTGGVFRVEINHIDTVLPPSWDQSAPDNRILRVCKALKEGGQTVTLVSNDINMRVKADLINVPAEEYKTDRQETLDEQYKGRMDITAKAGIVDKFYQEGSLKLKDLKLKQVDVEPNMYFLLKDEVSPKKSALARYNGKDIIPLMYADSNPSGITGKNVGQKFVIDALMAPASEIPLVILKAVAGTGKTILALAAGLEKTIGHNPEHSKILVVRPNIKMDEDIGFLKGSEREKIDPLIRPIYDNLEILTGVKGKNNKSNEQSYAQYLFDKGIIDAQALAYMRGRSVANTWLLLDEAQNMTPNQAFSIISRTGINTKIVLCGDPEQIDHPRLDSRTNGLSFASERMKGSPLCAQVTLPETECVRSALAQEAIMRMSPKGFLAGQRR